MIASIKSTKHKQEMDDFYLAKLVEDVFTTGYDLRQTIKGNFHCIYNFEVEYKRHCMDELFLIKSFETGNVLFEDEMFLFCRLVYFFEKNFDFFNKSFQFKAFYNNFYTTSLFSKIQSSKSYKLNTRNYTQMLMKSETKEGKTKHKAW